MAGSNFLNADKPRAIGIALHGLSGKIQVNGKDFNSQMPALNLSDEDVANVLTYVYNSWGNSGHEVLPAEVAKVRAAKPAAGK